MQQLSWPDFSYKESISTIYLIHLCSQIVGKLKLLASFEAQWANVVLYVTTRGLTTGLIPYENGAFSIDFDFINHQIILTTSAGETRSFQFVSMSVAKFYEMIFKNLKELGVNVAINIMPIEIPHDIKFSEDTEKRHYEPQTAQAWWKILLNTQLVMEKYHSQFWGKMQPIGLMWGHLDLRDVRYNGKRIKPEAPYTNYIFRNSLDEAQIMCGFWHGNEEYPKPAYYAYTYPQPVGIEQAKIKPSTAYWNKKLGEFILDYDALRQAKNPAADLLSFFESTYQVGAELAGWDSQLIGPGKPI